MRLLLSSVFAAALLSAARAEPAAPQPYPLSGYWLFGRSQAEQWPETLDRIQRVGADTVIQFGAHPSLRTPAEISAHPVFSACLLDGHPLLDPSATNNLRHIYTFETQENFGPALLADPRLDRRAETATGHIVWRLILPATNFSDRAANAPPAYDLLLVSGRKADSVAALLTEASRRGQHVFVGMPSAMPDPRYPWDPHAGSVPVLLELTRRVLSDYAARYGSAPSFAGLYQSLETPVSSTCLPRVLDVYRAQHALVRAALPGKRILISPYWDARKTNPNGVDARAIKAGIQLLARQNVDIIAPQDSRGTGKVGLFWPHQTNAPVDVRLAPAVGASATYGEAYRATTTDFYRAAREELDDVVAQEGKRVELWANIEAFEPHGQAQIQRTSHERLDQAIMFAGLYPAKLISFMWDNYFTTKGSQNQTLGEELETDGQRPIVVDARRLSIGKQAGLLVRGYNVEHAGLELVTTGRTNARLAAVLAARPCAIPASELPTADLPERLQTAWAPFDWTTVASGSLIELTATNAHGKAFHPFVLRVP